MPCNLPRTDETHFAHQGASPMKFNETGKENEE
jgi:hypothetical protein